jgi:hypothetical protein
MKTLQILVILFGIAPILGVFIWKFIFGGLPMFGVDRFRGSTKLQDADGWFKLSARVPWKVLGSSVMRLVSGIGRVLHGYREPQFSVLRCRTNQMSKARWRLEVELQILNPRGNVELVIDDIHARLFERDAFQPPYATISRYGDVWLRQDNTLFKEKDEIYSLPSGDGYLINLVFEATRIEGAPAYGWFPTEHEGSVLVVFGLLLDYYFNTKSGPERHAIPSDHIFVFGFPKGLRGQNGPALDAVNKDLLDQLKLLSSSQKKYEAFVQRLDEYLKEHLTFRPVPKA